MALSMKRVASELLMCGLKNLPFVGTAVEVVEGVRSRHEMLAHADRLAAAENLLTRMEKGLRDLVEKEIRTALDNLRRSNLDGPTLTQEIRNLQEIRRAGNRRCSRVCWPTALTGRNFIVTRRITGESCQGQSR